MIMHTSRGYHALLTWLVIQCSRSYHTLQILDCGIRSLMTTVDSAMPLEEALARADELYYHGAVRMFRFIKTGMMITEKSEK